MAEFRNRSLGCAALSERFLTLTGRSWMMLARLARPNEREPGVTALSPGSPLFTSLFLAASHTRNTSARGLVNSKRECQRGTSSISLVFSPDGKSLATGGYAIQPPFFSPHGELKLWDVATLKEQAHLKGHLSPLVRSVAFSPDGKLVAA